VSHKNIYLYWNCS